MCDGGSSDVEFRASVGALLGVELVDLADTTFQGLDGLGEVNRATFSHHLSSDFSTDLHKLTFGNVILEGFGKLFSSVHHFRHVNLVVVVAVNTFEDNLNLVGSRDLEARKVGHLGLLGLEGDSHGGGDEDGSDAGLHDVVVNLLN